MKALTGLPTAAYLKVSEEAHIQLSDLLKLVQHLEAGSTPAYIARYRPDIAAHLDEERLCLIEQRLRDFLELEDRRITILTTIGQQNRLTPELRSQIEASGERWELEDLYLAFKPRRPTPADEAAQKGLEPLARFLWDQQPEYADIEAIAQTYLRPEQGPATVAEALAGARHIVARWLGEDPQVRQHLRPMVYEEAELVVLPGEELSKRNGSQKNLGSLKGYRAMVKRVPWRQMLAVRRGIREAYVRQKIVLPERRVVEYLLARLLRNPRTLFCSQLAAAACEAFQRYLAPSFESELALTLNERCDQEAIRVFQKNLRRLLMTPPAGPMAVIGLETGRPGGWRAAVVGPDGEWIEGAILLGAHGARDARPSPASGEKESPESNKTAANERAAAAAAGGTAEPVERDAEPQPEQQAEPKAEQQPEAQAEQRPEHKTEQQLEPQAEPQPEQQAEPSSTAGQQAPRAAVPKTVPDAAPAEQPQPDSSATAAPSANSESAEAPTAAPPGPATPGEPAAETAAPPSGAAERKPQAGRQQLATCSLADLVSKHQVAAIAMGNGPGVRQVERFIRKALRHSGVSKVFWMPVHEAGSWIYATSKTARRELPGIEPALRSATSLARRLQDPLSEFIKVDPKLLGVGQFHHDVEQKKLRAHLRATVAACVHSTGVDLNTASLELLSLVPGLTERVAKRIIEYRQRHKFATREQLRKVPGISDRLYEQAVGFCRVRGGENILDDTGIHPKAYPLVAKMLAAAGLSATEALENPAALESLNLEEFQSDDYPLAVLRAMVREFQPSVRNPRGDFAPPQPAVELRPIGELKAGMKVDGIITNITTFGAFVDIGAEQDGLVHISHLSDGFVEDPKSAVKVGDRVSVHILAIEENGKRISLSMKEPRAAAPRRSRERQAGPEFRRGDPSRRRRKGPDREGGFVKRTFGPDQKAKEREAQEAKKLSLDEKLALLERKFRTQI